MKFSPLILLALASVGSAAPAAHNRRDKCKPKTNNAAVSSPSTTGALPTGSEGGSGGVTPTDLASSPSPTVSISASPSAIGTESLSTSSTGDAPSPSVSATPTTVANGTVPTDCHIPEIANQSFFLDPNVVVQMPPSRGSRPNTTELIVPPGSVGINPDGGVPASDPIAQILLERINQYRSIYKAPPMEWNQTISQVSVDNAKRCIFEHLMGPGVHGEVLLDFGRLENVDLAYNAKWWIDGWMIEGFRWDFDTQKSRVGKDVGHWQILTDPWSHQVGCGWQACGKVYCNTGKNYTDVWDKKVPDQKGEHVWPQICEPIPWATYMDPDQPDKVWPSDW